jgi:hypothetical protein
VVEGIGGKFGLPPAYVRTQQICWVEITGDGAELVSARVELPGATRMERFVAHGRNPHSGRPVPVASWPAGPDWPAPDTRAADKRAERKKAGPPPPPPLPPAAAR